MNLRIFTVPAFITSAIVVASGCVVTATPDATLASACFDDGSACGADSDCCSGVCTVDGVCVEPAPGPAVCSADGDVCGGDGDCCNGFCDAGVCATPVCAADGDVCSTDADCCGGDFCDYNVCSVCVSDGNACDFDSDCCSGFCDAGFCSE